MSARSASPSRADPKASTVVTARPKQIHRYEILSELGRGSMGRVYLASDPNIDRHIALKVLIPERLRGYGEEEMQRRFLQEAKAAGRLSHSGIVTIFDADTDPESGCPFLAMEWVPGCSLKELLRREGPFVPERAVSMAVQISRALDYAHRNRVVHRDIKPANLLVSGGETERVKVVDFGIAKLVSKSITQPGRILGSPYYMAPEQVRGLDVDGRTDLFSLGAVLYECLTGQVAFGGETVAHVTHKILADDPRPIELYNPDVPVSLRAVVRRALEKLPKDRYRSGAEMAAALETVGAELTLGLTRATSMAPSDGGGTTTQVLSERGRVERARPSSARAITGAGQPAVGRRWPLALMLATVLLSAGVWMGRSLVPRPPGVANSEASSSSAPVPEATVDPPMPAVEEQSEAPTVITDEAEEVQEPPDKPPSVEDAVPAVNPSRVAAPATRSSPPATIATTNLEIIHENRIKRAYLSVWIDGRRALSAKLETRNPFKRIKGREHRWLLPVPTGKRSVEIHVSGVSKSLEARRKIWRVFSEGDAQRLTVEVRQGSERLGFLWEEPSS